ncbi:DUF523 domain-containing protein [Chromobacterium sp. IIBBL 290-4]|uniref:DUF523 domain-containing protein n=1 Tax=Chromobacterium sp. IIBBL 290-4 TaxID=2953890 RepID=UPI0020B65DF5|nr:DUF523 domain-containing protein [Chromobacterium sp. IIBBL 290-4]UTH76497.1 DUF523 domain-containing protein [Chromobacterium sp. IIBBL 290-4]
MKQTKLLISACLLGQPVRYDGQSKPMPETKWAALQQAFELIPVCPECLGGLPTPRPPAEISGGSGCQVLKRQARVKTAAGEDISLAFISGAEQTLAIAQQHGCHAALLKANSPSCGNRQIYNGNFEKTLRSGQGVTAALLEENGVRVWNEEEWQELLAQNVRN